jgi:hypothetical protein
MLTYFKLEINLNKNYEIKILKKLEEQKLNLLKKNIYK